MVLQRRPGLGLDTLRITVLLAKIINAQSRRDLHVANHGLKHPKVMGSSDSSQSGSENVARPVQTSIEKAAEMTPPDSTALPPFGVEEVPGDRFLSVPFDAFYDKLPKQLLTPKKPDLARLICIASDDVVSDQETKEATILLSILSLSCPEIFAHPIQREDDVAITFPLNQPKRERLEQQSRIDFAPEENTPLAGLGGTPEGAGTTIEGETKSPSAGAGDEIRLKLEPILANLPPGFELPPIPNDPQIEIALPADLVKDQLKNGRVSIAAAAFCALLPEHLKHIFGEIEPTAEIPIPLREIFPKLPSDTVKLREDYELGYAQDAIRTPFTFEAKEDAIRCGDLKSTVKEDTGAQGIANVVLKSGEAGTGAAETGPALTADVTFPDQFDSHALQALFMTEEVLDLPGTVQRISELPGLRACLLTTMHGTKLAGKLVDPRDEPAIPLALLRLFRQAASTLAETRFHSLEGATLYCDQDSLSVFLANDLLLSVLHDHRPFRPGVREKIVAVMQELEKISRSTKQSERSNASA
jgi:hypothetical protein